MWLVAAILGKGIYACVCYDTDRRIIYDIITEKNIYKQTTNNRMEILGLLKALELTTKKYQKETCIIYCDSAYCVNMFNN